MGIFHMMREIVLDTETTSTDAKADRIIEVGCVELVNHTSAGRTFHCYRNPQRVVYPVTPADRRRQQQLLSDTDRSLQLGIRAWSLRFENWGLPALTATKSNVPDGRKRSTGEKGGR